MALLFTSWLTEFFFTIFCAIFLWYLYFKAVSSQHWKKHKIVHLDPVFIFGNFWKSLFQENITVIIGNVYKTWKHEKILGVWNLTTPGILVNDLDIIKTIMTTDFNHFRDRIPELHFDYDPLAANLFNITGAKWRNLRVKVTPTFTSGKMKMMFPTMVECGKELQEYINNVADGIREVDIKDVLARFTTDIISSCAFGIQSNSLKNPDSEFRKYGRKIFEPNIMAVIRGFLFNLSPNLAQYLRIGFTPKDVSKFFLNAIKETMDYREQNNVRRNDFMDLLIQLKNKGKLEDVDGIQSEVSEDGEKIEDITFTFEEAAAQAFVFFAGGFETSSTTLTFAFYELSLNSDIQTKLQKEIDDILQKHENKINYESIHEMEYLDCVVQETLRKYPPLGFLFRTCTKEYTLEEKNVTIPKGTQMLIPVYGIQRDPEFYPDPEKFDPDRFSAEEKSKRHHYSFLPFGEGPRICIGNRFGLLQTKIGLISILSKFTVRTSAKTPIPMKYDVISFVLASKTPVILKFEKRVSK